MWIKKDKKFVPSWNDDPLNVHNVDVLTMWRKNVDYQPIFSRHAVLKYIAKYASKVEIISKTYHEMLTRVTSGSACHAPALASYRRFLAETLLECDIGAQGSFLMLLKLHHVVFSHKFIPLNVGNKFYERLIVLSKNVSCGNNCIKMYQTRPHFLAHLCLIEMTRSWSFDVGHRHEQWKAQYSDVIFHFWAHLYVVIDEGSQEFETFC